jgi:FAD/FMN-containing dehydrogenase
MSVPWVNWSGSQVVRPRHLRRPTTLAELQEILREAAGRGGRVKPVATGLSFSDILQGDDTLLEVTGLLGEADSGVLLALEPELWRAPSPTPLVRIAAGARIRQLNAALGRAGLAFGNLGGYDGQTLIGAISTSTHGSGLTLGPLASGVRSLDLVTADGSLMRVEPSRGLTDPAKFKRRYGSSMTLVQSDDWFFPVVVSMGCMGVIHSVTMAVSPAYRLYERRRIRAWSEVERELSTLAPLRSFRNYEVVIAPYRRLDGDFDCLVTERNVAAPDLPRMPLPKGRQAAESLTFLASTQSAVIELMANEPRMIPAVLRAGLEALETGTEPHIDDSYLVYNVGFVNTAHVVSGEYFFPLRGGLFLRGIRGLLDVVEQNARAGIHQPSPLALRFVAGSRAPLSMTRAEPHCTVEIAIFAGFPKAAAALLSYEKLCIELGGRPHWGQIHELTGKPGWLASAYPDLEQWLRAYRYFNARGTFNNHFTDRLGLSLPQGRAS